MIALCTKTGLSEPEYKIKTNSVILTIKRKAGVESGVESDMEQKILNMLISSTLSKKQIAISLGKKKPTRYLNDLMKKMVNNGTVEYTIPDKPNSRLQKYKLTKKGQK